MTQHTPEPWVLDKREELSTNFYSDDATGSIIGGCQVYQLAPRSLAERQANARRIVACVNACEGMDDPVEVIKGLKEALARTTHQVITCGVAARHPDANLSRREGDYGGKWDSPQAESVRQLRQERDELLKAANHLLSNVVFVNFSGEWNNSFVEDADLTEYCQPLQDVINKITGETK